MKYVVIGGGVAALEGARILRELDPAGSIVCFSDEKVLPYRRPALSRMIAEDVSDLQFLIRNTVFFEQKRIDIELNTPVVKIDRSMKHVQLQDGRTVGYDKLLIATGARCFIPPFKQSRGVTLFSLRNLADLEAIRHQLADAGKRVVILGGGLLGLELADACLAKRAIVTVVELCPTLLPRQLDGEFGAIVAEKLTKIPDFQLELGAKVASLKERNGKTVIALESGKNLTADVVLVSAGSRSNCDLAREAGLECNRGIVADAHLRTGDPDIYVAGDCAEVEGRLYGLYNPAKEMGEAAGRNMAGESFLFKSQQFSPARLNALGFKLVSAGMVCDQLANRRFELKNGGMVKLFFQNEILAGVCLLDALPQSVACLEALAKGASREEAVAMAERWTL